VRIAARRTATRMIAIIMALREICR
jgi:hypothetical protein